MKKLIAMSLAAALLTTMLAGCGEKPAEKVPASSGASASASANDSAQPFKGEKIRVIFGNHVWTDVVKPLIPEFTAQTGIEVVAESYPEDQLNQKISVELTSGGKNLDVFMTRPLQETKLFIKNGWLMPLDSLVADAEYDSKDFIPSALDIFKDGDKYYGVPLITEREILYYRKDLLKAAGVEVPTTFEELEAAAKKLTNKDKGQYGFVARGMSAAAVTQFSSFLRGMGGDFFDANNKATLNTPEAIKAFEYYGNLLNKYGPPGTTNMHWQQAAGVYSQGNVAMYTDADAIYNSVCGPDLTKVHDTTGFAVMPGSKPYNICSWGLSVSAGSEKSGPAMEFIKWASSKDMIKKAQMAGNSCSRQSVWADPEATAGLPAELVEVINKSNPIGVASDRPLNIQVGKARDSIGLVIVGAIDGKDVKPLADKANKEFQAILDEDFGK
ncbi:MAG: sugar ABC transporter substrate-binding protein [Oscillospiraceae bacterium]